MTGCTFAVVAAVVLAGCGGSAHQAKFKVRSIRAQAPPPPAPPPVVEVPVEISERVYFGSKSSRIHAESQQVLDEVARLLDDEQEVRVEIRGFASAEGNDRKNLRLSRKRAERVREYLIRRGIAADRLMTSAVGEDEPTADNSTREGREQNRRVEFVVVEADDAERGEEG